jgi:hypothetical protein
MRRSTLAAVAAVLVLTSCAEMRLFSPPDPHNPVVVVRQGEIMVNQDPLIFAAGDRGAITWHLGGTEATFPDDGIVVKGEGFRCARHGPTTFVCQNGAKPGHYKYTIKVIERGRALEPYDPFVYNQ